MFRVGFLSIIRSLVLYT